MQINGGLGSDFGESFPYPFLHAKENETRELFKDHFALPLNEKLQV